ncbi:MAG: PEP-CTERM sorting domain-containing protein [Planctomycetes bacterium]|nr:PEP-CTERM sorting domain-containing protein [Planctomycetota bacterium]
MNTKRTIWLVVTVMLAVGLNASATLVDSISTTDELTASGDWLADGFTVAWDISPKGDGTWHYEYDFTKSDGSPLTKDMSHFIIQVSENFTCEDIFNGSDGGIIVGPEWSKIDKSNPGIPDLVWGVKIDGLEQNSFSFDSTRAPMWGDFYAKDGKASTGDVKNYVHNSSFGKEVDNVNDYGADNAIGVDPDQTPLHKILVPDTIPEPATMFILGLGSVLLRKRK